MYFPSLVLGLISLVPFSSTLSFSSDLQNTFKPLQHTSSTIRDILLGSEIISDVLDDFEPSYYINIIYPKSHEGVFLGNDIPVKSVSKRPTFIFRSLKPTSTTKNSTFTLVMTDPDATSRAEPVKSEMCHWIMTNLTTPPLEDAGNSISEDIESSKFDSAKSKVEGELESYYPPAPPKKTGKHRYVFVLLEGDATNVKAPDERPHWGYGKERHGVRDWAKDNGLTVVGANFFYAQNKKQ